MRVAFINNQIDNRGVGNAVYDYAHYNETLLGNESILVSLEAAPEDPLMGDKIRSRFGKIYSLTELLHENVDVVYHIKYGNDEGWFNEVISPGARYAVHAVFDGNQPHGDRYATISKWMGERYNIPYVPHIVEVAKPDRDLREELKIPKEATVLARYGGKDTFDIPWVWDVINATLLLRDDIYFLFMNTDVPNVEIADKERVIFLSGTSDPAYKSSFIHASDAMLHARGRGETFGIAVGEFAASRKPVLTYGDSPEKAHIEYLDLLGLLYYGKKDLGVYLTSVNFNDWDIPKLSDYDWFTPERVMKTFKEVFLD